MSRLACALALIAAPAFAQGGGCAAREAMIGRLGAEYGESPRAMGIDQRNVLLEVFVAEATGTWTVTVTRPDGVTCILAAGAGWDAVETPKGVGL